MGHSGVAPSPLTPLHRLVQELTRRLVQTPAKSLASVLRPRLQHQQQRQRVKRQWQQRQRQPETTHRQEPVSTRR